MTTPDAEARPLLLTLTKTDLDARVRHRAHVLLVWFDAPSIADAAKQCGVSTWSIERWWRRWRSDGRDGLADRGRPGRPRTLPEEALTFMRAALATAPNDYGYPTTVWTIADLRDVLERNGWTAGYATVHRRLAELGYVYTRPRHDLTHRQDAEPVASATKTLETLQKRGLLPVTSITSCISTNARFTPIPTWSVAGNHGGNPPACPPLEPTSGSPSSERWTTDRER